MEYTVFTFIILVTYFLLVVAVNRKTPVILRLCKSFEYQCFFTNKVIYGYERILSCVVKYEKMSQALVGVLRCKFLNEWLIRKNEKYTGSA